jgi:hypothetical protein
MEHSSYHSRSLEKARMLLLAAHQVPPTAVAAHHSPSAAVAARRATSCIPKAISTSAVSTPAVSVPAASVATSSPLSALRAFESSNRNESAAAAYAAEQQQVQQKQLRTRGTAQMGLAVINHRIGLAARLPALLRWEAAARLNG